MTSISNQLVVVRPASPHPSTGPNEGVPRTRDSYDGSRSGPPQTPQSRLNSALLRVQRPSAWRRVGDNAEWACMTAFHRLSDGFERATGAYPTVYQGSWDELRRLPPQSWFQAFVFGSASERASAYKELEQHREWQVVKYISPVSNKDGMGSAWSPRALIVVRGLLHQLLGLVTEAEAITLVRDALDRLKVDAIERRYVGPIRRSDYMLDSEADGDLHERRAHTVRALVGYVRAILEQVAAHLEDDATRRRIFEIPERSYLPRLGIVEPAKKKRPSTPGSTSPPSGQGMSANVASFFGPEGAPWRIARAFALGCAALVGAVLVFVTGGRHKDAAGSEF